MIEFRNVSKQFNEFLALKNIDLKIENNDIYGIIGMSGAGKSTLVRLINGLIKANDGQVLVEGKDIGKLSESDLNELRSNIGMVFQHFNLLLQKSVLDNVALPLKLRGLEKRERNQRALEILKLVGLEDKANSFPSQLSGGQKQRVAIARSLVNENKILLCDEATSALDPISTQSILDLIKDLKSKLDLTVVIITHEMDVVEQVCNKVAILDNGELVESGKVSQVFKNPQHFTTKKLLGINELIEDIDPGMKSIRLTFDGLSAYKPIVSELVLLTGQRINILHADTREIEGKLYGQMIVQLPSINQKALDYLKENKVDFNIEEVNND